MAERQLVSFTVRGRPATFATAHEAAWKAAVRAAVAASGVTPSDARFAVAMEFRTPAPRNANEVWDLDNLIKPTLDAMEGIFGSRPWKGVPQPADDRVDRLEASKRAAATDDEIGATIAVSVIEPIDAPPTSGSRTPPVHDIAVRRMADADYRRSAWEGRHSGRIQPINRYVEGLREPAPPEGRGWVPYVHDICAGVDARLLTLFRDPGPKTHPELGGSGFLSLQNDDPSAEAMARLLDAAGVPVDLTVPWNVYPWWMNRNPTTEELDAGGTALLGLLELLPDLDVVVLHGGSAQRGWRRLVRRESQLDGRYEVLSTHHTSRQAFWHPDEAVREQRREDQLRTYRQVAALLADR